jgi:hypothetical protein
MFRAMDLWRKSSVGTAHFVATDFNPLEIEWAVTWSSVGTVHLVLINESFEFTQSKDYFRKHLSRGRKTSVEG